MNDARSLLKFLKLASPVPAPQGAQAPGSTPMNPVQLAVQQQQAAALGQATPEGNPEVMKAQESSIQAQQQAAQQIAQVQQQAQQEIMKAQTAAQDAQMKAMGQSQGMVQKLQTQLDAAHSEILKSQTEAELAKLETQKAELFQPEPLKPEPVAPGPDHRPTLKRMSGRIGKALAKLEGISPHLKLGAQQLPAPQPQPVPQPKLPYTVRPDGQTVDIDARPQTHAPEESLGYKNPAAGVFAQQSGGNGGILDIQPARASFGSFGDQVYNMVKGVAQKQPDYMQHFRTNTFEPANPFDTDMSWLLQLQQQQRPVTPWWAQMAQAAAGGFAGTPMQPPPY